MHVYLALAVVTHCLSLFQSLAGGDGDDMVYHLQSDGSCSPRRTRKRIHILHSTQLIFSISHTYNISTYRYLYTENLCVIC